MTKSQGSALGWSSLGNSRPRPQEGGLRVTCYLNLDPLGGCCGLRPLVFSLLSSDEGLGPFFGVRAWLGRGDWGHTPSPV